MGSGRALLATVLLCWTGVGHAEDAALQVSVPRELHVGDHVSLLVMLTLPADAQGPLLLTPRSQGEALEVVRGRLLRADARDQKATPLAFDLPVVARVQGSAVLRVKVATFRCHDQQCEPLELEAQKTVVVLPR
jgi:hypothetical protein